MAENDQPFEVFEAALKKALAALREAGVPFLLGGSLASWARGGPETRHDLDFIVKPEDADAALQALEEAGMRPEHPPEEWLYKAWDGEVLIDVIFGPRGIEVTDEVIERGETVQTLGISMPLMAIEDVLATKLLALDEHDLDYSSVLQIARALRERIDWRLLRSRTRGSPYAAAFFTLADGLGVASEAEGEGADVRVLTPRDQSSG
jgi:predicted nucleotidyltransferase